MELCTACGHTAAEHRPGNDSCHAYTTNPRHWQPCRICGNGAGTADHGTGPRQHTYWAEPERCPRDGRECYCRERECASAD